jgi:hypothetical protein
LFGARHGDGQPVQHQTPRRNARSFRYIAERGSDNAFAQC